MFTQIYAHITLQKKKSDTHTAWKMENTTNRIYAHTHIQHKSMENMLRLLEKYTKSSRTHEARKKIYIKWTATIRKYDEIIKKNDQEKWDEKKVNEKRIRNKCDEKQRQQQQQ